MPLVTWKDGLERTDDGEVVREIPLAVPAASSVWISAQGAAYRRYYNFVDRSVSWTRLEYALDPDEVHVGLHIPAWTSMETAIARAWRTRAPRSNARVQVIDARAPLSAATLRWREEEYVPPEPPVLEGETWTSLRWVVNHLVLCSPTYDISNYGRLRSPHTGAITRGHWCHGERWAAVKGAGLVQLRAAAGLARATVHLPPRTLAAHRAMTGGMTPADYSAASDIPLDRAYRYCVDAVPFVRDAKRLVARDLRRVLEDLRRHPALGGPLRELRPVVARRLGREVDWGELRFARACVR